MKMYFYYGVMGSSKTANVLMKKFNFEERGRKVVLLKPSIDNRDGETIVKSRIGLECKAVLIGKDESVKKILKDLENVDVVIVDEAQFLSKAQVEELRDITNSGTLVMCYGLKTDYMCNLFEGSKRLLELSDTIRELPSMCRCGRKAIINARYNGNEIIYHGGQIDIGGTDKYVPLCHQGWIKGKI